jgi:hypothetical protein
LCKNSHVKIIAIIAISVFGFWNDALAAEYATTDGGRRVLLKDDGSWADLEKLPRTPQTPDDGMPTDQTIRQKCLREWTNDFSMRAFCEKKQREAVHALGTGRPQDISQDEFKIVRNKCTAEWPDDFSMRAFCEKKQFGAIRELRR